MGSGREGKDRQLWVLEELFSLEQMPLSVLRKRYASLFGSPAGRLSPHDLIARLAHRLRKRLTAPAPSSGAPTLASLLLARVRAGRVSVLYLSPPRTAA